MQEMLSGTLAFNRKHNILHGSRLSAFGLIFVLFLLLTGAQVQLQPPVQGLVPYGDDD